MMSTRARVEEVSDSDPEEADIDDFTPDEANSSIINPTHIPTQSSLPAAARPTPEQTKHWQTIYPVYFDKGRSCSEGRRVSLSLAVANPLARTICDAVFALGLRFAFEPWKDHPKDWANPGRVKVLLKENGRPASHTVKNKQDLYVKIAQYLNANPTTEESPMRLKIPGLPSSDKPVISPAVPRGWKMNSILPLHSAALSGGGVSENLFKDMMAEMQGQGSDPAAGAAKSKKIKKSKG